MNKLQEGVRRFLIGAGDSVDRFNAIQATRYLGLQCEELAEKLLAVSEGTLSSHERERFVAFSTTLDNLGKAFKRGDHSGCVGRADHDKLIDADFNLAFVSVGALYSTSIDGDGAISEGCRSNLDKLVDGEVIRDEHGKIQKPMGWRAPDFTPFVDASVKDD